MGFCPVTLNSPTRAAMTWLRRDNTDGCFVGLWDASTAFAWNSQTNQLLTHAETWLNELRLERDGRYLGLTGGGPQRRPGWEIAAENPGPGATYGAGGGEGCLFHKAGGSGWSMWPDPK